MLPLLNPKEIKVIDRKGTERTYIVSEIPAVASREIVCAIPDQRIAENR